MIHCEINVKLQYFMKYLKEKLHSVSFPLLYLISDLCLIYLGIVCMSLQVVSIHNVMFLVMIKYFNASLVVAIQNRIELWNMKFDSAFLF